MLCSRANGTRPMWRDQTSATPPSAAADKRGCVLFVIQRVGGRQLASPSFVTQHTESPSSCTFYLQTGNININIRITLITAFFWWSNFWNRKTSPQQNKKFAPLLKFVYYHCNSESKLKLCLKVLVKLEQNEKDKKTST